MYFAVDYFSERLVQEIADAIETLKTAHSSMPLDIFMLIDGAFDEDFLTKVFRSDCLRISLYDGTPLSGFGEAAVFLVQTDTEKLRSVTWVAKFIDASGNRPMWSLIVAALNINDLAKHFAPFLTAKTADSLEWPIRWADVRILPELMREVEPQFINDLLKPIYSWFAPSRNGSILTWCGQGIPDFEQVKYEKLPMCDKTFARLVEASEPDMVASQIYDRQPEFLKSLLPSECYRRIARQLKIADLFNLKQPDVRQHFSTMALFLREDFIDMPAMKMLLENVKNGSDYMSEIAALDNGFWEDAYSRSE